MEKIYTGVYQNQNKTVDLDFLNSESQVEEFFSCINNTSNNSDSYYITKSGEIIHSYTTKELVDWYADIGPIYDEIRHRDSMGKDFVKIKDKGEHAPHFDDIMNLH